MIFELRADLGFKVTRIKSATRKSASRIQLCISGTDIITFLVSVLKRKLPS